MKGWIAHWSTNHWCLFRQFRAVSQIWSLEAQLNSGQDVQRCQEQWQIILGPQFCFQMSYSNSFYRFGIYLKKNPKGRPRTFLALKKMSMISMIWCNTIWSLLFWDWDCFSVPSLRPVIWWTGGLFWWPCIHDWVPIAQLGRGHGWMPGSGFKRVMVTLNTIYSGTQEMTPKWWVWKFQLIWIWSKPPKF